MKTTRNEKSELKKEEFILAAKHLFAKQGYHATSTRSINTAIGASDGLLYHYFPSGKKELLLAVVEYEANIRYEFFLTNIKTIKEDLPLREFLHLAVSRAMENLARDADIFIIMMREAPEISKDTTALISRILTEVHAFLSARFARYIHLNLARDMNVHGMVHQFITVVQAYAIIKVTTDIFKNKYSSQEYADFVVSHMLNCWEK